MAKIKRRKEQGSIFTRYRKGVKHALDGISYGIEKEHNLLLIMVMGLIIFVLGIIFPISLFETIIIVILIGLSLVFEMINTSIEATVDLITTKTNALAKIAKDTASSANFIMIFITLIVTLLIFIPKISSFIGGLLW